MAPEPLEAPTRKQPLPHQTTCSLSEQSHQEQDSSSHHDSGSVSYDGRDECGSSDYDDDDETTDHDDDDMNQEDDQVEQLAKTEAMRVLRLRIVVYGLALLAGIVLSVATYGVMKRLALEGKLAEYYSFTNSLNASAAAMFTMQQSALAEVAETVTLAGSHTSNASTWPNVSVDQWESRASFVRTVGLEATLWAPIVSPEQQTSWAQFSTERTLGWLAESRYLYAASHGLALDALVQNSIGFIYEEETITGLPLPVGGDGPWAPVWQVSPPPGETSFVNYNLLGQNILLDAYASMSVRKGPVLTPFVTTEMLQPIVGMSPSNSHSDGVTQWEREPWSLLLYPVVAQLGDADSDIVGVVLGLLPWSVYFRNVDMPGIVIVVENSCGGQFTFALKDDGAVEIVGKGDLHNVAYDFTQVIISIEEPQEDSTCRFFFSVYASSVTFELDSPLIVNFPVGIACGILAIFILFRWLDWSSMRGSNKIIVAAMKANAILTSLFPKIVRDRMLEERQLETEHLMKRTQASNSIMAEMIQGAAASVHAGDDQASEFGEGLVHRDKPIADLFPETTIMFADIAGFTAWSSVREPSQVFQLLETLYHAFDKIAKRRRVFKVETIGDCYVAVTGLPQPRKDHAIVMCRFARECLITMDDKVRMLEQLLGPDTAELKLRAGLHSGPVTAGVLRGERARFQLFGDTMNTASRMESTGLAGQIQLSQETADLLIAAGKSKWVTPREHKIIAKGKGEMQTYWIAGGVNGDCTVSFSGDSSYASRSEASLPKAIAFDQKELRQAEMAQKQARLVNWCVDVLLKLLKSITARRNALRKAGKLEETDTNEEELVEQGTLPLDEVVEIIQLPQEYVPEADTEQEKVRLEPAVIEQLHEYVTNVASIYHDNPFHNFEHASHVTMSATKLLSRIVAPHTVLSVDVNDQAPGNNELHDHTYGITSDPLTQFTCVLGTLIHDADHIGVPNTQLVKEGHTISEYYKGKSIAEQNSVDICWSLLMQPNFAELRRTIFCSDAELRRFRQLLVNVVMATDIMDKDLKVLRNKRWEEAFSETVDDNPNDTKNRKATIVIEHLIQASDVAHTMQHWHIYRKWNERFFLECHKAFQEGRAEKDPSEFWYQGEMGFYDFYIIPLAKKLKDCGVFGVASDEYLNYAIRNRKEWEERGQEIVSEMVQLARRQEWCK